MAKKAQPQLNKRASSRSKINNKSTDKIVKLSPSVKKHNMKQLKQQAMEQ